MTLSSGPFRNLKSDIKPPESSSSSSEDEDDLEAATIKFQKEALDSHNQCREKHGVAPLKIDKKVRFCLCFSVFFLVYCFVHPIFSFWFFVTFGNKVTKKQKYYAIFVYILQGKMGNSRNEKKFMQLK